MKRIMRTVVVLCTIVLVLGATVLPAFSSGPSTAPDRTMPLWSEAGDPVIQNQTVTNHGAGWEQRLGYPSYKIWVENTTGETMRVTHTAGLRTDVYIVAPNSGKVVEIENNALPLVYHELDFATSSGTLSGRVSVRISTVDQWDMTMETVERIGSVAHCAVEGGTRFEMEISRGSAMLLGREAWEKGDEIVLRVEAAEEAKLEVGIWPCMDMDGVYYGYNDYGGIIGREIDAGKQAQELTFTVPESGEYGFGVTHFLTEQELADANSGAWGPWEDYVNWPKISVTVEINREFLNPLQGPDAPGPGAGGTAP